MGANTSNPVRQVPDPQDIGEFRKLTGPADFYVIPEVPEKRKVTDFKFTVTFGVCLLILFPFLIYSLVQSDLDRFVRGYDKCGNICGENNSHVDGIQCSGQDKTDYPLLEFSGSNRFNDGDDIYTDYECVQGCDTNDYEIILNRCFPRAKENNGGEILANVARDINRSAGYIVAMCFIGFGLSVGMLFLFRYCVTVVVWIILVGSLLGLIALTGFLWYLNSNSDSDIPENKGITYLTYFFTIATIVLFIVLLCMIKRIKLVIRLFKEAIKVIFGIPLILFEPLLTFLASTILLLIFVIILLVLSTAGTLEYVGNNTHEFVPNVAVMITICYHCIISLWMLQFIIGCQHMVISGAVSAYYFARDKSMVSSPIYNSFYNLIRYHLGTVAFGSLIITVISVIKALIRSLTNSRQAKLLVDCCLGYIEEFIKFLSKNAYIQTAMHGQPFYKSGKRAVRLLAANALSTIAVNSVGDFILFMAKLLIVVATVGIGILMRDTSIEHYWAGVVIAALVTSVITDCFFSVFETAVDTIFLCFCEDSCMNDGMDRPYYMTTDLMQYMEEAKKTSKEAKNGNN